MEQKDKYNQVLSLALEIEGLAVLLQRRGDLINPEIHSILREKVKQLDRLVGLMEGNDTASDYNDATQSVDVNDSLFDLDAPGVDSSESNLENGQPETDEEIKDEEIKREIDQEIHLIEEKDEEEIAEAVFVEQSEDSIPDIEKEDPVLTADTPVEASVETKPRDLSSLLKNFTLNDRFRFRRELFKGKDEDFTATLSHLASMTSSDEVKEYLEDDLCLDLDNADVHDFYETVVEKILAK